MNKRRPAVAIPLVVSVLAACALYYAAPVALFWLFWEVGSNRPPFGGATGDDLAFNRARWVTGGAAAGKRVQKDSTRGRMLGDLQRRVLRPGASRRQVKALLGPPDGSSQAPPEGAPWGRRDYSFLRYELGPTLRPGLRGGLALTRDDVLTIYFDEAGRLTRVEVHSYS